MLKITIVIAASTDCGHYSRTIGAFAASFVLFGQQLRQRSDCFRQLPVVATAKGRTITMLDYCYYFMLSFQGARLRKPSLLNYCSPLIC